MIQNLNKIEYSNDLEKVEIAYNSSESIEDLQLKANLVRDFFEKELKEKMAIRKVNIVLSIILGIFIMIAMTSYYFVTVSEMTLNKITRETADLNDANAELQYKLDKLKSFNNVDMTIQKNKTLTRAKEVLEVPQVNSVNVIDKKIKNDKIFSYSIGY